MSGGSWDYAYQSVEYIAERLSVSEQTERKAFSKLLFKVSKALKAIEWVDIGDSGPGDEIEPIKACFSVSLKDDELDVLEEQSNKLIKELQDYAAKLRNVS